MHSYFGLLLPIKSQEFLPQVLPIRLAVLRVGVLKQGVPAPSGKGRGQSQDTSTQPSLSCTRQAQRDTAQLRTAWSALEWLHTQGTEQFWDKPKGIDLRFAYCGPDQTPDAPLPLR